MEKLNDDILETLLDIDIDKRHSPKEVENLLTLGINGSLNDLKNIAAMILIEDFRLFMKSKGFKSQFSESDLSSILSCDIELSKEIFRVFNSRLKAIRERELK
jgi:hypothetical protein